jgi:hypothetical protein
MSTVPWITKIYAHTVGFILPAAVLILIVDKYFLQDTVWNFDVWRIAAGMILLGLFLETGLVQGIFNAFPGISTKDYRAVQRKVKERYQKPLGQAWALFESDLAKNADDYQVVTWRESMYNFFRNLAVFFLIGLLISLVVNVSGLTFLFLLAFLYSLAEARAKQKQLALVIAEKMENPGGR